MKFSIIVPTFNRIKWLKENITSCQQQTYKDIEIVVPIDDRTNDGTFEMLNGLNDNRINYYIIGACKATEAINDAFLKAQGDYITLLPDDDLLYSADSLSVRQQILEDYEVVYTAAENIDINGDRKKVMLTEPVDQYRIWEEEYIHMITMAWQRKVFDKIGYFNSKLEYYTDWDWKIKCLMDCKCYALNVITIKHRQHPGQETKKCLKLGLNDKEKKIMFDDLIKKYGSDYVK